MPSVDLLGKPILGRFDVVGECLDGTAPFFVAHVALHNADRSPVSFGQMIDVVHMGPPLKIDGRINAYAAGRVPLTLDEITMIEKWIAKIEDEYRTASVGTGRQYVIHPPWKDCRDKNTGIRRYRRYSCAGFVLDAHREVDIHLLAVDSDSLDALPEVDKNMLVAVYPETRDLPDPARYGLEGDGPWRIVLAGYVLHALDRTADAIRKRPYQPRPGDECISTHSD